MIRISDLARIIFWNVNNKNLTNFVCKLASSTNADVVVLNENTVPREETLLALQNEVSAEFYCPNSSPKERFHCFCKNRSFDLSEVHSDSRLSVRRFHIGRYCTLLVLFHGVDMRNYDSASRQSYMQMIANDLEFIKEDKKNNRLILLGDFNMNPYDTGMNLAAGLNAMMTKSCVRAGSRRFQDKKFEFFYNPMWGLFGDNTDGPAGTVYDTSNQGPYGWSMLDQVVINHSIVGLFQNVRILTEAANQTLMDKKGRPDSNNASDHFPILVDFSGENNE